MEEKIMLHFTQPGSELFLPNGCSAKTEMFLTTHLVFGAHQDDIEIMAASAIIECFNNPDLGLMGVVVTDGRTSPRAGCYQDYSDEDMRLVRREEQKKAAVIGNYKALALLDFSSQAVKDAADADLVADIQCLLSQTKPEFVYTHNLADKHETHVGVALKVIEACRRLDPESRPKHLYGCEVWRGLDWMTEPDQIPFDCSGHENLQAALLGVYDSQIAGGKRYDLATMGRRKDRATYFAAHGVDATTGLNLGMDLTPLIEKPEMDIAAYAQSFIDRFAQEVRQRLAMLQGKTV
jgi:LmbE family N-acetylglucosaminyl deacetylase